MLRRLRRRARELAASAPGIRRLRRPPTEPTVVKSDGVTIPLGPHITPMVRDAIRGGVYEQTEATILKQRLTDTDIVLELGTGIGFISALCALRVGSESVFTYEANPCLYSAIRELYRLNSVNPELRMYPLGPADGVIQLHIAEQSQFSSAVPPIPPAGGEIISRINVEVRSFERERSTLPRQPNFLICDIEGGEFDFFAGVALEGIDKIICEVHDTDPPRPKRSLLSQLGGQGFKRDEALSTDSVWYLEREA